jgi:hypothetical protein
MFGRILGRILRMITPQRVLMVEWFLKSKFCKCVYAAGVFILVIC